MTTSLRRTALSWMTALLTLVGLAAILIAYWYARTEAAEFLDGQLREIALNAGAGTSAADAPASSDFDPEDPFAVTIWGPDGTIVHASLPGVAFERRDASGFADVTAGGQRWRAYTVRAAGRTVEVAQRETVRAEIADDAALGVAAPIVLVIPLAWLVVGWAMTRVLGRLDGLAAELAARGAAATEPISLDGVPREVAPLVEAMNGLVARLRAAVDLQKRFLADAAHELRTPLAAMQIQVDNLATGTPGPGDARLQAIVAGVKRASALVDQLLRLARLEAPPAVPSRPVDLGSLVLDCVADVAAIADRKGLDIGVDIRTPAVRAGDEADLRALLGNLIDNAVRYTCAGGTVDVTLDAAGDRAVLEIVDTGPGLPTGEETRIFDRFYRGAARQAEGSGLGLAIARRIAERHGLGLTVDNRADGLVGVVARVTFGPAAADQPG